MTGGLSWNFHALWIIIPVIGYGFMYLPCKFPVDERVQAGVPYMEMLRQAGFLGAALASCLVIYEVLLLEYHVESLPGFCIHILYLLSRTCFVYLLCVVWRF